MLVNIVEISMWFILCMQKSFVCVYIYANILFVMGYNSRDNTF